MLDKGYSKEVQNRVLDTIKYLQNQGLSSKQITELVNNLLKEPVEIKISLSVFQNDKLSCLETIVKYLRENLKFSFKKIGSLN